MKILRHVVITDTDCVLSAANWGVPFLIDCTFGVNQK